MILSDRGRAGQAHHQPLAGAVAGGGLLPALQGTAVALAAEAAARAAHGVLGLAAVRSHGLGLSTGSSRAVLLQ